MSPPPADIPLPPVNKRPTTSSADDSGSDTSSLYLGIWDDGDLYLGGSDGDGVYLSDVYLGDLSDDDVHTDAGY